MEQVDKLAQSIANSEESLSSVLRKCLVLAYDLDNDVLKTWIEKELNGYSHEDELPEYRQTDAGVSKGYFVGHFNQQIPEHPIPSAILKKEHRHWATTLRLVQPVASYENVDSDGMLPWPANLVMFYQKEFFQGDLILQRAWMEVPKSMMISLTEIVRTKLLTFVLEIRKELGDQKSIASLEPEKIEKIINLTIHGGTNVFGDVQNFDSKTIVAGDFGGLQKALTEFGVTQDDVFNLERSLQLDGGKSIGKKTGEWMKTQGKKLVDAGIQSSVAVASEYIKLKLSEYLGLPPK